VTSQAPHLDRNYYDRLGHFAQGFVPAMIAREVLLRTTPLKPGKMLFYLVLSICMAISAWYELLEFAVAETDRLRRGGFSRDSGRCVGHAMGYDVLFYRSLVRSSAVPELTRSVSEQAVN